MSSVYDINRSLEQTMNLNTPNKEPCNKTLCSYDIDILKLKPSVLPAQWYINYSNAVGEGSEGKDANKTEVTFDGLLSRMSRLERELSEVQSSPATAIGEFSAPEFATVDNTLIEEGEDCADELETGTSYSGKGRRRSLSEGDTTAIALDRNNKTKNSKSKTRFPPPISENILSRSLSDLLTLSTLPTNVSVEECDEQDVEEDKNEAPNAPKLSVGRKSISVDIYSIDAKNHNRRKNLGNEEDDALSALDQFQQNIKGKGKQQKKTANLRPGFAQSLESLVKTDKDKSKGNFITRAFTKRHMDSLEEETSSDSEIHDICLMKGTVRKISKVIEMRVNEKGELIRTVEIHKLQNQCLGFFIKFGNGIDRDDGIFISRVTLGSLVDTNNLLHTGDEIIKINQVDVVNTTLEDVVATMQKAEILIIETRSALPFDTHAVGSVRKKSNENSLSVTNQSGALRTYSNSSVPKRLPIGEVTKKRSYTGYDQEIFLENDAYDPAHHVKSKNALRLKPPNVQEIINYDASSSSDSDELNNSADGQLLTYKSDSMPTPSSIHQSFTGKLTVNITTMSGLTMTEASGNCYCTVEINKEFKAKTKSHQVDATISFDDDFDIDIQGAKVLIIKLYQENRLLADKCIATSCILLERLFEDESHQIFILSSTKDSIRTRLNVKFTEARRHLERRQSNRASGVFGFNLSQTLVSEKNTIPILVRKCVAEIEKRGLDLEGIYRISGNARKKKELREQFERNSYETDISDTSIDCHVITGILKDYLRKLPSPLISEQMYKIIHEKQKVVGSDRNSQRNMLKNVIKMAPYVNRATLIFIMDHFQRVTEHIENNKMSNKNIAVCFGPVMLSPPIEEMKDFQKYIDALEFLISIWPMQTNQNMI